MQIMNSSRKVLRSSPWAHQFLLVYLNLLKKLLFLQDLSTGKIAVTLAVNGAGAFLRAVNLVDGMSTQLAPLRTA
jgi:hypothetical protein